MTKNLESITELTLSKNNSPSWFSVTGIVGSINKQNWI